MNDTLLTAAKETLAAGAKSDPARYANAIRALAMDAVEKAKSGHPGMPMGMADVAAVLFQRFIVDVLTNWTRAGDHFHVLSAAPWTRRCWLPRCSTSAIRPSASRSNRRPASSPTAGHPEYGHAAGIETTGPLGQIATAVGMAIAERLSAARFGDDLVDHFTYVIAGDGCLMEGVSHEAGSTSPDSLKLSKAHPLFWDDNVDLHRRPDEPLRPSTDPDRAFRRRRLALGPCRRP